MIALHALTRLVERFKALFDKPEFPDHVQRAMVVSAHVAAFATAQDMMAAETNAARLEDWRLRYAAGRDRDFEALPGVKRVVTSRVLTAQRAAEAAAAEPYQDLDIEARMGEIVLAIAKETPRQPGAQKGRVLHLAGPMGLRKQDAR